ncbi:MAG: single-stranded-DNA-specific exonuclease RecJ [Coriobacteriaceae bacterium]|nr:single-stranded-DNA-specific exonuclease RecJ [Coriobacteriaceae bacterium]
MLIAGMPEAAGRVVHAVRSGRRIVVFGDFDLDGVSSAALATVGLRSLGADVAAIVPHRFREGYGLSAPAIERMKLLSPELVITVDCGISGAAEVEMLRASGIEVVVTDHHEPGEGVPSGVPIVDPKLADAGDGAVSASLAGAGVALKLVQAVGGLLGAEEAWRDLADLAMLGTVADIVPLDGENRALVAAGLASMRTAPRVCLAALAEAAGVDLSGANADTVAFALAPRLNAAGRVADPSLALDLLLEDDPDRAAALARTLDEHNRLRQEVELDLYERASQAAERVFAAGDRALVLSGEQWHEGVKGIVASRLANEYGVPALLFSIEDGIARGSGRSAGRVDLHAAVTAASETLERFGGHTAAVGMTLAAADLPRFEEAFRAALDAVPEDEFASETVVDAEVPFERLGVELAAEISLLEPFGFGNPRPLLATRDVFMTGRRRVGKTANHLRFDAFDGALALPAVAFRCRDISVMAERESAVDLAYQLDVDEWRGRRRVQLLVRDIASHEARSEGLAAELVDELFERADEILAGGEYAGISDADSFHTKLAGVTFEGRQAVLSRLVPGTPLRLDRQPENPHDACACALFAPDGEQVGFLNRRLAAVLAPVLDAGVEYDVEVSEVTGGEEGRSLGVNVVVVRRGAADAAVDAATRAERRAELRALDPAELDAALVRHFIGERPLHEAQREALEVLSLGESCLLVMATGRGKSLVFHLHAAREALRAGRASVFVYPLRALVADQAFHLEETLGGIGLAACTLTGETAPGGRDETFAALAAGELDVVLTTPEFLDRHAGRFAETGRVGFLVVDEAHHVGMARAGHRPAYARLGEVLGPLGGPTVLAVTATAGDETAEAVRSVLGISRVVTDPTVRENLRIEDRRGVAGSVEAKDAYLASIAGGGEKLIVYVNSREQSVRIARALRAKVPPLAYRTAFYNGGLARPARHAVERAFREGDITVVVATSAFGEGVNIPDIRHVALYHMPFNDVEFNQMSGRAGRDGLPAHVHLLFGPKDAKLNEMILDAGAPERDDLAALWLVLKDLDREAAGPFEITNAELAEQVKVRRSGARLTDKGVSAGVSVFRELGLVTGEGHGAYRRLALVPDAERADLASSVRYAEARDEIEQFAAFREWVLGAPAEELLVTFNRPILPTRVSNPTGGRP